MDTPQSRVSEHPYPGLRPFLDHESDIFFGRENQLDVVLGKLKTHHFVAIIGVSGCGKSSLVRAGLIPALKAGFLGGDNAVWHVIDMRPGEDPLVNLVKATLTPDGLGKHLVHDSANVGIGPLWKRIQGNPRGIVELVQAAKLGSEDRVLLLVDQFEEVFRYRERGNTSDVADAFVSLLLRTAEEGLSGIPVYVIITMRSDFLGDCAVFRGLPEAMNESQFLTPRLTRDAIRDAIVAPAEVFNSTVTPELVNTLLNDTGTDPDLLPILQHALRRMWTVAGGDLVHGQAKAFAQPGPVVTLKMEHYRTVGSLSVSLSQHAEQVLSSLSPDRQILAQKLFCCLTEKGAGQRDTRRPTSLGSVAEATGASVDEIIATVEPFRASGVAFITPPYHVELTHESKLDISHESLIRQWRRLNRWVAEEADRAAHLLHLADAATRWRNNVGDLLTGRALHHAEAWMSEAMPTMAWATRYVSAGDFEATQTYVRRSRQQADRSRKRVFRRRLAGAAVMLVAATMGIGLLYMRAQEQYAVTLAGTSMDTLRSSKELALGQAAEAYCVDNKGKEARSALKAVLASWREDARDYVMPANAKGELKAIGFTTKGPWAVYQDARDFRLHVKRVGTQESFVFLQDTAWSTLGNRPIYEPEQIRFATGTNRMYALSVSQGCIKAKGSSNAVKEESRFQVFDLDTGTATSTPLDGCYEYLSVNAMGTTIAVGNSAGAVQLSREGQIFRPFKGSKYYDRGNLRSITISADGKHILLAGDLTKGEFKVNPQAQIIVARTDGSHDVVAMIAPTLLAEYVGQSIVAALSPDNKTVAVMDPAGMISTWAMPAIKEGLGGRALAYIPYGTIRRDGEFGPTSCSRAK